MNLQEAVGWLLENNALPFQSTANYVGNTEIAMSTLINPSPAKVRVGSIIFFADSKVSTVVGVTSNSFIVSDQYNDLVDDVVYVSNVAINASGHLIVTLSNGTDIDAGLIKQVTSFSINASQHLIASYNDGTTTDLGAIFNGNVNIAGNFTADSIIENMSGYGINPYYTLPANITPVYYSICKNGNKLTFVLFGKYQKTTNSLQYFGAFAIPSAIGNKIYPSTIGGHTDVVDFSDMLLIDEASDSFASVKIRCVKLSPTQIMFYLDPTLGIDIDNSKTYVYRHEITVLLSDNLLP